jgi:hypothetical protein
MSLLKCMAYTAACLLHVRANTEKDAYGRLSFKRSAQQTYQHNPVASPASEGPVTAAANSQMHCNALTVERRPHDLQELDMLPKQNFFLLIDADDLPLHAAEECTQVCGLPMHAAYWLESTTHPSGIGCLTCAVSRMSTLGWLLLTISQTFTPVVHFVVTCVLHLQLTARGILRRNCKCMRPASHSRIGPSWSGCCGGRDAWSSTCCEMQHRADLNNGV